jgi:hypothetical protein
MSRAIHGSTGNGRNLWVTQNPLRWVGMKSRMNREIHVRIREGLGVRLPGATRLNLVQALLRNVGTCRSDVEGEIQVEDPRG